jgi:hypothetical protein
MAFSGLATLFIIPALITIFETRMFKSKQKI